MNECPICGVRLNTKEFYPAPLGEFADHVYYGHAFAGCFCGAKFQFANHGVDCLRRHFEDHEDLMVHYVQSKLQGLCL